VSSYTRERRKPKRQRSGNHQGDLYEAFLAFVKRERSQSTWEHHQTILRQLQDAYPVPELTVEQVRDWLARPVIGRDGTQRQRSAGTKRTETGALKAFWRFLAEVKMPPHPRRLRPKSVTRKQVNDLLGTFPTEPQRALVLLMSDAGLRVALVGRGWYRRQGDAPRLDGHRALQALLAAVHRAGPATWPPQGALVVHPSTASCSSSRPCMRS
jgi:integrase